MTSPTSGEPRLVGRGAQRVGVAEPLGLGVEGSSSPGSGATASISSSPCRSTSAAWASSRAWLRRRSRSAAELPPALVGRAVAVEQRQVLGAGVAVQGTALLGRPGQPQLVGLPVHGEQPLGQLGDHPDRHAAAAEEGPRPALGAHRAGEDQAAVVVGVGAGVGGALPRRGVRRAAAGGPRPRPGRRRGPDRGRPGHRRAGSGR